MSWNNFPSFDRARHAHAALVLAFGLAAQPSLSATVDFEDTNFGVVTVLGDRYLSQGLRISGTGPFSGVAYSEGMFGVANFGNSSTQVMDIGLRSEPTFLRFVDPTQPSTTLGVTSVRFLAGDAHPDEETFAVSFFDIDDHLLSTATYTTTTEGIEISATSASLGALIGLVRLEVLRDSRSGAVIDDLVFFQTAVGEVDEPASVILSLTGLLALAGTGRQYNKRTDRTAASADA